MLDPTFSIIPDRLKGRSSTVMIYGKWNEELEEEARLAMKGKDIQTG